MSRTVRLVIFSDIHYVSAAEQARGDDYEFRGVSNPVTRNALKAFRHYVWMRNPLGRNTLLERLLLQAGPADYAIANGDYSCDTSFVGVSDNAVFESAQQCIDKLRARFGDGLRLTIGDHELGKLSLVGARGGMRIASYHRVRQELGLKPFWSLRLGQYVLMGLTSSLVALPAFEAEIQPGERAEWEEMRQEHLAEIRAAFSSLESGTRVLLFCHDPTALPFLRREESVRCKLSLIEQTIVGHLHSNLILWKSRVLAGMPTISFLGHSARRMSAALREAPYWKPFHVRLCPALGGIQLLNDGGFYVVDIDPHAEHPAQFQFHRLGSA